MRPLLESGMAWMWMARMATFPDPRDPPFPKPGKRGIRSEGHQGPGGMWIVGTATACCTATCRDPSAAAIFCNGVDSLGWAARRPHQGNLFTNFLGTWSAPASTPRFVVARRTNCRFTAPYSSAPPRKKGKVWRCGLKDVGRELGIGSRSPREHCLSCMSIRSPSFPPSGSWQRGTVRGTVGGCKGVQLVLARPQGFPS
jgi:hypothetical protein